MLSIPIGKVETRLPPERRQATGLPCLFVETFLEVTLIKACREAHPSAAI
jgi:hypothetical protein